MSPSFRKLTKAEILECHKRMDSYVTGAGLQAPSYAERSLKAVPAHVRRKRFGGPVLSSLASIFTADNDGKKTFIKRGDDEITAFSKTVTKWELGAQPFGGRLENTDSPESD